MKTTVKARHFDLTDALRLQIDRRLRRLDRVAHPGSEASVELIAKASHSADEAHVAEVTLVLNGSVLRSASYGATPIAALDSCLDKLERQVVREKQKPRSVRERSHDEAASFVAREATGTLAGERGALAGKPAAPSAPSAPSVVRTKRFDMQPIFEEDAIAEMNELGHAFFVFLNAETESVCVVYRRAAGDYGLIEPVLDASRSRD